jgi:DNA repair exonuclease SbcCD nuclease subunit
MSKIVVLGDLHIGARNASMPVAQHQLKFLSEQLIPYCLDNGIDTIFQLGDSFDSRKFTSHTVFHEWDQKFFQILRLYDIKFHMLLGNHDIATKNTLEINSPSIFLSKYDNIHIYDRPKNVNFGGIDFLFMPWININNHGLSFEALESAPDMAWVLGHFEIENFEMHRGQVCTDGISASTFNRFDTVLSGHFHTKSSKGNIRYVGTPYQMTWIDHGEDKGFHVIDTDTKELTFIKNKFELFNKIYYDDRDAELGYHKTIDLSGVEDSYVKIMVLSKTQPYEFEKLMDRFNGIPTLDLKVVEDLSEMSDSVDDSALKMEDTMSLIDSYIDGADISLNKETVKKIMRTLYLESLEVLS